MKHRCLVSVTNSDVTNRNALLLFASGLQRYGCKQWSLHLLYPDDELSGQVLNWLREMDFDTHSYPLSLLGDPYAVKFLLDDFVSDIGASFDEVLYLDPDHLVRAPINIDAAAGEYLFVSSQIPRERASGASMNFDHSNTSLIFGNPMMWRRVLKTWRQEYDRINAYIPVRFREEVAFTLAAARSNVSLIPVDESVQSHLSGIDHSCQLFHYGGDSWQARLIKRCVGTGCILRCLKREMFERQHPFSQWVYNEMEIAVSSAAPSIPWNDGQTLP